MIVIYCRHICYVKASHTKNTTLYTDLKVIFQCVLLNIHINLYRATVLAARCWLLIMETCVQSWVMSSKICVGQTVAEEGISLNSSGFPC